MRRLFVASLIAFIAGSASARTLSATGEYIVDRFILTTTDTLQAAVMDSICASQGWVSALKFSSLNWLIALSDTSAVAIVDSINANPEVTIGRFGYAEAAGCAAVDQ